jgi:SAM-dependent methyltransferase
MEMEQVRQLIRERSPFSQEETEQMLAVRFDHVPQRLTAALERWPLDRASVLDVGCGYGNCLIHFGPGSTGIDNGPEETEFVRALGLDVHQLDVEEPQALEGIGQFDYVWVSDMLEHLDAPRLLLRNLHPAVGGALLLHVSVLPGLTRSLMRRIGEIPFDRDVHYHQWTVDTIQHLLRRAGYRPVRTLPVVPTKLRRVPIPANLASRIIIEAVPDEQLLATMRRSEARNKHLVA